MAYLNEIVLILYSICLLVIFSYTMIQGQLLWNYLRRDKEEESPSLNNYPFVTIQLPVYNEKYVVERLIEAVSKIEWPFDKLEIQVLDDSTDETLGLIKSKVDSLKQTGLNIEHIHRENRTGYKAGALEYGSQMAHGEFIAVFDSDFIPNPDFLKKTVPQFNDERIGMVQSRWGHLNSDYSLMTRIQAYALNAHFTIEQKGRNASGLIMNFNGTAGIWRKKCIEDAGGWQHDTLTEDLDLSYRAQLKGWKFKYLEDVISPAELPVVLSAFKTQQFRWTKGSAETSRKHLGTLWKSGLSIKEKIHSSAHLLSGFVFISIFLLAVLSLPVLYIKNTESSYEVVYWIFAAFSAGLIVWFLLYYFANADKESENNTWLKRAGIFPVFLSMSMGMSLHNSIAAIKGYMRIDSPFIRTPKFNILNSKQSWKNNSYLFKSMSAFSIVEGILALYFLAGFFLAVKFNDYGLLPFHLMLVFGFGSMFFYSVEEALVKRS